MKFNKVTMAILFGALISNQLIAEESKNGLGVSIGDAATIYYQINRDNLRFEPTISLWSNERQASDSTTKINDEFSAFDLGLGLFINEEVYKNTFVYYGARFGYSREKRSSSFNISSNSDKQDGYFIKPTLGAEYFINSKFSIGIDVGFYYSKLEGERTSFSGVSTTVSDIEETYYRTATEVIVRYHF